METVKLLQRLIQFDTTNPPGNEKESIFFIKELLEKHGVPCRILCKDEKRPNLYARIKGRGNSAPILFYGHLDVVAAREEGWKYPPFSGHVADGCVWGRGALDMKGGIAIIISAVLQCLAGGGSFPGDVILCFVSDEEDKGEYGAGFLVDAYPGLFEGVKYAFGEFGGFPIYVNGKKNYFIQVAEKQICRLSITFTGKAGHGSLIIKESAPVKMARFISTLNRRLLPVQITSVAGKMLKEIGRNGGFPLNIVIFLLLQPLLTNFVLKLMGPSGDYFYSLLRNVLNPAIFKGGKSINVVPDSVEVHCDGRVLPGIPLDLFISEVQKIAGSDATIRVLQREDQVHPVDYGMFDLLKSILAELDPSAGVIPGLLPGSTDGRFFSKLGIQSYGFIPMNIPRDIQFLQLIHGPNERIPIKSLDFGTTALSRLLQRF